MGKGNSQAQGQPSYGGGGQSPGVPSQLPQLGGGPQGSELGGLQRDFQLPQGEMPPWLERMQGMQRPRMRGRGFSGFPGGMATRFQGQGFPGQRQGQGFPGQGQGGFDQGQTTQPFQPGNLPITTASGLASTQASPVGHATTGSVTSVSPPSSVAAAQPSPSNANAPSAGGRPDMQQLIKALRTG